MDVNKLRNKFFEEYWEKAYYGNIDPHRETQFKSNYVEWLENLYLKTQANLFVIPKGKFQIKITENNYIENEIFNYIIYVDEREFNKIEKICDVATSRLPTKYFVVRNTTLTPDKIKEYNEKSNNKYLDEYGLYEIPKNIKLDDIDIYDEGYNIFYKGGMLIRIY